MEVQRKFVSWVVKRGREWFRLPSTSDRGLDVVIYADAEWCGASSRRKVWDAQSDGDPPFWHD